MTTRTIETPEGDDIEISLAGAGGNTLFEFMYRDASNYKQSGAVVLNGRIEEAEVDRIVAALNDGTFFIPEQVGLEHLHGQFTHGAAWDEDDDHVWHTISAISYTDQPANAKGLADVHEFVGNWPDSPDGWDEAGYLAIVSDRTSPSI